MSMDVEVLLSSGMEAAREGRWDEARSILSDAVARDPGNLEGWLWLGAIAEDPQDAVAYLGRALQISPNSVRAKRGMEWAQEKLAASVPSPLSEPAGEAIAVAEEFAFETQPFEVVSPPVAEIPAQSLGETEVLVEMAPVLPETDKPVESALPEPAGLADVRPEVEWQAEQPFVDEGLAPFSVKDEEFLSPLPAMEEAAPEIIEIPQDIVRDAQAEETIRNEESPLTVPLFDADSPAEADMVFSEVVEYEQVDASIPIGAAEEGPVVEAWTQHEQFSDYQVPISPYVRDAEAEAPAADSWEAIIDRLRALDEEQSPEAEEPAQAGLYGQSVSVDEAPSIMAQEPEETAAATTAEPVEFRPTYTAAAGSADELAVRGRELFEAGQVGEAIRSLKRALELDPGHVEATEQLGMAEYQVGNLEGAVAAFEAVIGLKPDHAEAHANLGFLHAERGETEAAIAAFRSAIQYNGGLVEAYLSLADLYKAQGDVEKTIEAWRAAIQLRPDIAEVHDSLAELYTETGKLSEAIWEYRLFVDRKPDEPKGHLKLAQVLLQAERTVDAAKEFNEALRCSPDLAEAHYGLASCLEMENNWDGAVAELEKALAIQPDYLEADERLTRLRAAIASQQKERSEEVKDEQKKKSGWFIFKRDK